LPGAGEPRTSGGCRPGACSTCHRDHPPIAGPRRAVPGSRPGWPGCLATRASSPGYVNNKAEHTAETRAVRQLPEGHRTEIRAAASSLHTTLRGVGGGPDAVRRQVIQLAAGFARTREEGRGRRDSEPVPGELALGASGLLALRLVAASSAHAWRSGPVVPTAVAAPRTTGTQRFTSHRTRSAITVRLAAGRRGRML
jgi:hypothetical protein